MVRARCFGRDLEAELERWVYVGDSTNDQPMFGHFPLQRGRGQPAALRCRSCTRWPAYITQASAAQGFAEVAQRLLDAQAAATPRAVATLTRPQKPLDAAEFVVQRAAKGVSRGARPRHSRGRPRSRPRATARLPQPITWSRHSSGSA